MRDLFDSLDPCPPGGIEEPWTKGNLTYEFFVRAQLYFWALATSVSLILAH